MKRIFILALAGCVTAFGGSSVRLPAGKTGLASAFPGFAEGAPFRVEGRVHDRVYAVSTYTDIIRLGSGNNGVWIMRGDSGQRVGCLLNGSAALMVSGAVAPTDFEFRFQRINPTGSLTTATYTCEIFDIQQPGAPGLLMNGSGTNLYHSSTVDPVAIATGTGLRIGDTSAQFDAAFIKVFSTTLPVGSPAPSFTYSTVGDLYNYYFEGASGGTTLDDDTSPTLRHLTWSSGVAPATVTTPPVAPICSAGDPRSFRALDTLTATSESLSLNNGAALTYQWSIAEKPAGYAVEVVGNNNTASTYSLRGVTAGQYDLALRVADSDGSATCSTKYGVVPATTAGVVIPDISTPEKSKFHDLLGPVIAHYKLAETWPYAAQMATHMADFFRTRTGNNWTPSFWEDPTNWKAGTLAFTVGSATVTGTGTDLKTNICNGGSTPVHAITHLADGRFLVYRYPSSDGGYNWGVLSVSGCTSETQVTLAAVYAAPADGNGTYSGLNYYTENSFLTEAPSSQWSGTNSAASAANFYNVDMAYWGYAESTGFTAPRTYAGQLADAWVKSPFGGNRGVGVRLQRDAALTGAVMRYLEDTTANAWVLTALNRDWDYQKTYSSIYNATTAQVGERDNFYNLGFLSDCTLINPSKCSVSYLNGELDRVWKPNQCTNGVLRTWGKNCNNNHGQYAVSSFNQPDSSWYPGATYDATTVSVTSGSRRVTLSGGTWPATYWDYNSQNVRSFWVKSDNDTYSNNYPQVFRNDQVSGTQGTITRISSTEIDLPTPWLGPNLTGRDWQYSQYPGQWFTQPFITGIGGQSFWKVYKYGANADALTIMLDQAEYIIDYGYNPAQKGMFYARGALSCELSTGGLDGCTSSQSTGRFLNGETLRLMAYAYQATGNTRYKTYGDKFYGAIFGDASCDPNCGPETDAFGNDDIMIPNGFSYGGADPRVKDFGFLFGMGGGFTYPAIRTGLTEWPRTTLTTRDLDIAFDEDDMTAVGATKIRITLRDQRGTAIASPAVCTVTPCTVTLPDREAGNYPYRIEFLSAGDVVLARSDWMTLANPD